MKYNICKKCGKSFYGGGSARYCLDCKEIARLENVKRSTKKITKAQEKRDYKILMKGL